VNSGVEKQSPEDEAGYVRQGLRWAVCIINVLASGSYWYIDLCDGNTYFRVVSANPNWTDFQ
jgi:hypothetical protein